MAKRRIGKNPSRKEEFDRFVIETYGEQELHRWRAIAPNEERAIELGVQLLEDLHEQWTKTCSRHAKDRAEEACSGVLDGDLWDLSGEELWNAYCIEIQSPLFQLCPEELIAQQALAAARTSFVASIEQLRDRRLGDAAARAAKSPEFIRSLPRAMNLSDQIRQWKQNKRGGR